jgi:hypothetical protein
MGRAPSVRHARREAAAPQGTAEMKAAGQLECERPRHDGWKNARAIRGHAGARAGD